MQHVSFCDWLISLSLMSSRFVLCCSMCQNSLPFYGWIILHYMYTAHFIHSSADGHLGYFHLLKKIFIFLFLVAPGLRCCAQAFSRRSKQELPFIAVHRLLVVVASRRAQALGTQASVFVAYGLSCSEAPEIFLDQRSNLYALDWQIDSYPLYHQGSPSFTFWLMWIMVLWICVSCIFSFFLRPSFQFFCVYTQNWNH